MEARVCQKCARGKNVIGKGCSPAICDQCDELVTAGGMYVIETDTFPPVREIEVDPCADAYDPDDELDLVHLKGALGHGHIS